jgi:hypothetical protein
MVAHKLLGNSLSNDSGLGAEFMKQSLLSPSAKGWLAEQGKEVNIKCVGCKGEWSSGSVEDLERPEILNGVWERSNHLKAKWGRKAPLLTKLKVMGAFLDDHFNEWISSDKRFRAREIHEFGWS